MHDVQKKNNLDTHRSKSHHYLKEVCVPTDMNVELASSTCVAASVNDVVVYEILEVHCALYIYEVCVHHNA